MFPPSVQSANHLNLSRNLTRLLLEPQRSHLADSAPRACQTLPQDFSGWMQGAQLPTYYQGRCLAEHLGVSVVVLLSEQNTPVPTLDASLDILAFVAKLHSQQGLSPRVYAWFHNQLRICTPSQFTLYLPSRALRLRNVGKTIGKGIQEVVQAFQERRDKLLYEGGTCPFTFEELTDFLREQGYGWAIQQNTEHPHSATLWKGNRRVGNYQSNVTISPVQLLWLALGSSLQHKIST